MSPKVNPSTGPLCGVTAMSDTCECKVWMPGGILLTSECVIHGEKPRTWRLPDEPGPEVTAVRDAEGTLFEHRTDPDGTSWWISKPPWRVPFLWGELLHRCGPLTDATAELSERSSGANSREASPRRPEVTP